MIEYLYVACMYAAVFAWAPMLNWKRSRQRRIAIAALGTAGLLWAGVLLGWSLRGELADAFALPVLLLTTAVGLSALVCMTRPLFRAFLLVGLFIVVVLSWVQVWLVQEFDYPPPVRVSELADGYRYDIRIKGMAFSSDFVHTRLAHSPAWLPLIERTVATSWVKGPDAGLVGDRRALAATTLDAPEGRKLLVMYEGEEIDRLAY